MQELSFQVLSDWAYVTQTVVKGCGCPYALTVITKDGKPRVAKKWFK